MIPSEIGRTKWTHILIVALDGNLAKLKDCNIQFIHCCYYKNMDSTIFALEEIFSLLAGKVTWKKPSVPSKINRNFDTDMQCEEH